MKKDRLLEIIREEIAGALGEASYAGKNAIPDMKKDPSFNTLSSTGKMDAEKELKTGGTVELEEDTLNEMAKITEPIRKGIEVAVNRMKKSKSDITPEEITKLIRNKKSQEKVAPELKAALDADEAEKGDDPKYTYGLGYPQTLGAVQIAMGLKKAKGSEPKAEKPAKAEKAPKVKAAMAPKAESSDDEDVAAAKAAGSDETAKELGSTPEEKKVKFNQFLASVKKNKDDKAKIDGILKLAKDKFKFAKTMMDDLKRAAGREVEA
jgi:hypothetical protein